MMVMVTVMVIPCSSFIFRPPELLSSTGGVGDGSGLAHRARLPGGGAWVEEGAGARMFR